MTFYFFKEINVNYSWYQWEKHYSRMHTARLPTVSASAVKDSGFLRLGVPTPEFGIKTYYYRPQTKFAKVMFSQVFVCSQGGLDQGGVCIQRDLHPGGSASRGSASGGGGAASGWVCIQGDPHWILWDTVNKWAVCSLLECILIWQDFCMKLHENEKN